ncbi:hypothetical protein ACIQC9_06985 [Brevundimonas sp. NPDC092305]|uniref:hypothetical protein n=1 Tax=Brevundimonas sp. NPDC092305 TaxID=3363957 RepID=UPI0037F11210
MSPYIRTTADPAVSARFNVSPGWAAGCAEMVFADEPAAIITLSPDRTARVLTARWGMPTPGREVRTRAIQRAYRDRVRLTDAEFEQFAANEPDPGVGFIDASAFVWRPHLEPRGRCVVPFSALGALRPDALPEPADDYVRPAAGSVGYLGGVFEQGWRGVRRADRGRETLDLFALVSVERIVQADLARRRFTPIVLKNDEEVAAWLTAPWSRAKALRRAPAEMLPA